MEGREGYFQITQTTGIIKIRCVYKNLCSRRGDDRSQTGYQVVVRSAVVGNGRGSFDAVV